MSKEENLIHSRMEEKKVDKWSGRYTGSKTRSFYNRYFRKMVRRLFKKRDRDENI